MDNQWQNYQPVQGSICPICSISHFPFCPPHPNFGHNPRYVSPQVHPFPGPGFDRYRMPSDSYHPTNGYRDPNSLVKNPNLVSPGYGVPIPYEYNSNYIAGDGDRNIKRVKIDDNNVIPGAIANENHEKYLRLTSEADERRLKLIHDHGLSSSGGLSQSNLNSVTSSNGCGENTFRPPSNMGHEFQDPSFGSVERKRPFSHLENIPFEHRSSDFPQTAPYNDQRFNILMVNQASNHRPLIPYNIRHPPMQREYEFHSPNIPNDARHIQFPFSINNQGNYLPIHSSSGMISDNVSQMHAPPLPPSPPPPPPPPTDSPGNTYSELKIAYKPHLSQPYFQNNPHLSVSTGFAQENLSVDKRNIVDASHLFKQPFRAGRPDHIVIILRGLPGSGKSYLAKMFRDLEVENGSEAPRIHSMDDYFMTEVEKVDESDMAKSTNFGRGKKPTTKKVMEYCYEPEMEEAYRSSMLKAFKKTLEEGAFTFIIVDDRNLRVADFAQFWAISKRSGYEVYLLEATYKDPAGCAARNVHGFSQDDIQKMATQWEEAPSWYLQLDAKSLFHGDDLKDGGIQEVDMDTEDRDLDEGQPGLQVEKQESPVVPVTIEDHAAATSIKDEKKWGGDFTEGEQPTQVKELGRSKWSDDLDEDDDDDGGDRTQGAKGKLNSLSGLIQAYEKDGGKSVRWGDQVVNTGFTIGAEKKAKVSSLVIGPGSGYNLKSNPLPEVNSTSSSSTLHTGERHNIFQEHLRAERESFKAVFDRRRHRIGLDTNDE